MVIDKLHISFVVAKSYVHQPSRINENKLLLVLSGLYQWNVIFGLPIISL